MNSSPSSARPTLGYLLDTQFNLLADLRTVVIPLSPAAIADGAAISKLCPALEIKRKTYIALMQQPASVDKKCSRQRNL